MSFTIVSKEECIEDDERLLEELREALSERTDDGYPKNLELSELLWKVLTLWKEGRR